MVASLAGFAIEDEVVGSIPDGSLASIGTERKNIPVHFNLGILFRTKNGKNFTYAVFGHQTSCIDPIGQLYLNL